MAQLGSPGLAITDPHTSVYLFSVTKGLALEASCLWNHRLVWKRRFFFVK